MSRAALSMKVFAGYIFIDGVAFLFFPEILHTLAGIGEPNLVSRIFGMVLIFMSAYYFGMGLKDGGMEFFYKMTVVTRSLAIFFLIGFWLMGWGSWFIILFGLGDLMGAAWTWISLQKDAHSI